MSEATGAASADPTVCRDCSHSAVIGMGMATARHSGRQRGDRLGHQETTNENG